MKTFTEPIGEITEPTRMFVVDAHDLAQYGLDGDLWGLVGVKGDDLVGFTAFLQGDKKPYKTVEGQLVRIVLEPDMTFIVL